MEKIYSKIKPDVLLHIVNRRSDIGQVRVDISPPEEYLQASCFSMPKGKTFKAHKHIKNVRSFEMTQESWIVIEGEVKAILYDLDDTVVKEVILKSGDCSMTFRGGHNYVAMTDNAKVYEYKTGPYLGRDIDKVYLN